MTIQLALPSELEQRLKTEAARQNQPAEAVALRLLDQHLPPAKRSAAVALLLRWADEDEAMTTTDCSENAAVLRALDKDRLSDRKLFPGIKDESP
jgi:hypothetical protein